MRIAFVVQLAIAIALSLAATVSAKEPYLRDRLSALTVSSQLGGATTRPVSNKDAFSFLAANAPRERQRPFSFGNRLFNTNWIDAPGSVKTFDGLGPMFNRVSCSGCHTKDGRGAAPVAGQCPSDSLLLRISIKGTGNHGEPKPHPVYGDQISERAIGKIVPEACVIAQYTEQNGKFADGSRFALRIPSYKLTQHGYGSLSDDLMISPRVAPAVIGLGLLEAVPDADLAALADPDDSDGDGISGRINTVWDHESDTTAVGRFGWKAGQPTLRQQNAAAANGDIGLTTPLFAVENCAFTQSSCRAAPNGGAPEISEEFLQRLTLYTRTLAVPAQRNPTDPSVVIGATAFRTMGCASCHLPTLRTSDVEEFPELGQQTFHPYTDLLLHDMGEGLADHRPEFTATGREWRTPPLWGIGLYPTVNGHQDLLHDGRARGVAEAILWHGGEAQASRDAFAAASASLRTALVDFVNSL